MKDLAGFIALLLGIGYLIVLGLLILAGLHDLALWATLATAHRY